MNNANETANGMMWVPPAGRFYRGFLQRFPTVFGCRFGKTVVFLKCFKGFGLSIPRFVFIDNSFSNSFSTMLDSMYKTRGWT